MFTKIVNDSCGNPIHLYFYEPEKLPIKGVIHVIHGAGEHFARYGVFADAMNKRGYAVIGADLLGEGLSTSTYDFVHRADRNGDKLVLEVFELINREMEERYPGVPRYLLGHSAGSFLARLLMIKNHNRYAKAIFTGSAYTPAWLTGFGFVLCAVIQLFHGPKYVSPLLQSMVHEASGIKMRKIGIIGPRREEWLSKDESIQQYYQNSPMCGVPFTVAANRDLLKWMRFMDSSKNIAMGNKKIPLLFASGADDALGGYGKDIERVAAEYRRLGYEDVSVKIYQGDRHEILNELDKETVYADILAFLEK